MTTAQRIPIEKIVKGKNPRTHYDADELQQLACSIKERGLIQPIVVEPHKQGTYLLVAGERRLEAHKLLKRKYIQANVRERTNHNGRERLLDAIIENDQRADMDPIDRAQAYAMLRDEYHMTTRQIAQKVGRNSHVIEISMLLVRLDEEIQDLVRQGFWSDARLVRSLLQIQDKAVRVGLAERLWRERVNLKGCWAAVEKTLSALQMTRKPGRPSKAAAATPGYARRTTLAAALVPSMEIGNVRGKPMNWDALRQLGQVPEWSQVVLAASSTCQICPLRDIASPLNCEGCAAVTILQRLVEVAR
jgi:ParB family transcriptional regulator, chromosome partitioning protein